jgi:hypothetical protein
MRGWGGGASTGFWNWGKMGLTKYIWKGFLPCLVESVWYKIIVSCLCLSSRSVTREYFPYTLKLSPSPLFPDAVNLPCGASHLELWENPEMRRFLACKYFMNGPEAWTALNFSILFYLRLYSIYYLFSIGYWLWWHRQSYTKRILFILYIIPALAVFLNKSREVQFVDKNVKYIQVMLKKSYLSSFDLLVPLIWVLLFYSTFEYWLGVLVKYFKITLLLFNSKNRFLNQPSSRMVLVL